MPTLLDDLPVPIDQQIREVERELKMRERVYPRWVETGRMKQDAADQHQTNMKAVLATLQSVKARS